MGLAEGDKSRSVCWTKNVCKRASSSFLDSASSPLLLLSSFVLEAAAAWRGGARLYSSSLLELHSLGSTIPMSSLFLPLASPAAFAFACSCFCRRRFLASFPMCCVQWLCKDFELGRITSFFIRIIDIVCYSRYFGALPLNLTYYSFLTGRWLVGLTWQLD